MTILFASALLLSLFMLVLGLHGPAVAAITSGLLVASPGFIELSSSCMLEIPALAIAMMAIAICAQGLGGESSVSAGSESSARLTGGILPGTRLTWTRTLARDALAGILFGAGLQMKLVPIVLLPLLCVIVWRRQRSGTHAAHEFLTSMLVLGMAIAITFVLVDLWIERGAYLRNFGQAWASHFGQAKSTEYGSASQYPFDWTVLLKNWDVTLPAIIGLTLCLWRVACPQVEELSSCLTGPHDGKSGSLKSRAGRTASPAALRAPGELLLLAWLAMTFFVFGLRRPWWQYYYIHTAIPLCWLAAIGILAAFGQARRHRKPAPTIVLCFLCTAALAWMGGRVYLQVAGIRNSPQTHYALVLKEIERFRPVTKYMFAEEAIYSFHARIPMVPQLAVLPIKRFWAGEMSNAGVRSIMQASKPEVILLTNDTRTLPFHDQLQAEYRLVYEDAEHQLYVRKDLPQ